MVYGALPASLGALGAFKPPDQASVTGRFGAATLPYIFCVALIPVVLTFVLVRQRLSKWYLMRSYLTVRTIAITLCIIIASSLVCAANGLLTERYHFWSVEEWCVQSWPERVRPLAECLLLSFAYLVGSSTLFLTVVKDDGNLPLLPTKQEVDDSEVLRKQLRSIATHISAVEQGEPAKRKPELTSLAEIVANTIQAVEALRQHFAGLGRERFYQELSDQLASLQRAVRQIHDEPLMWNNYFGSVGNVNANIQDVKRDMERLKEIYNNA